MRPRGKDYAPKYSPGGNTIIGGALRPRLYRKLFWNVHSPDGHVGNPEAGLNIILYSVCLKYKCWPGKLSTEQL